MMPATACEIASNRYRYLEDFFTAGPVMVMADPLSPPAEKERKIDQALAKLEEGIQGIIESDNYREYLRTLGKFHDYSLGNLILIWFQNPQATRVAGYNTWLDLKRFVKKGEKGLMILAPCFPPKGKPEAKPEPKPEGEEEEEEHVIVERPIYFKVVYVFDISQTEGQDLPGIEVPVVQGENSKPLFDLGIQYAEKNGIKILDQPKVPVDPDTMGYFAPQTREIWVRGNVPQNQQTKSLFHEIAHSRAADKFGPGAEVLAESVAFAVCNHFGFDTGARSFPYVALWAKDVKGLKQKLDQIRAVTKDIIEEVSVLAELRDAGLNDVPGVYGWIVSGLAAGVASYAMQHWLTKRKKVANLEEYHTEGLACKFCGRPVPPKAIPEIWAGYHIKYEHRDYVKTLAKGRLPWVAGLTVVGDDYPLRKEALQKLKPFTIIEVHDDGDLTVRAKGKEWIVSTEGKAYVNHKLGDSAMLGKMMLLTQEIRKRLPPLKATEHQADPMVQVKFFTPWTYWTWYATEFDGEDEFYGLVRGHEIEMGYFSLKEMESVRGPFGLTIERDRHFEPTPLSKVREILEAGKIADTEVNMGDRVTDKDLQQKLDIVNRGMWLNKIPRMIQIGKRYGYKALDVYDTDGKQLRTIRTGLSSGQVDLILDGMVAMIDFYEALAKDPELQDLTPSEKNRQLLLKQALEHIGKAENILAKASEFSFYVDEKISDGIHKAAINAGRAGRDISNTIADIVAKELSIARPGDQEASLEARADKQGVIQTIIEQELMGGRFPPDDHHIVARARELARFDMRKLSQIEQSYRGNVYDLKQTIEKATYEALGKPIPAWLKQSDIEGLADDYVLPVMKEYPGDKLSLAEIKKLVKKEGPPPFNDEELEAAMDYLEEGGEVISIEKTAEKPKRWTAPHVEDPGLLCASREIPKLIEVYKTTISKHYRPKAAFHRDSFRVMKPNRNTLIWLGCLKQHEWKGGVCSENQTLHKTIVKKTASGMREVEKLKRQGIEVKYFSREGIEPQAEDDLMQEIADALNKSQPIME